MTERLADVVNIEVARERRPEWFAAVVDCQTCGHAWTAVCHRDCYDLKTIECANCHEMTGEVIATVIDGRGETIYTTMSEAQALGRDPRELPGEW